MQHLDVLDVMAARTFAALFVICLVGWLIEVRMARPKPNRRWRHVEIGFKMCQKQEQGRE